MRDSNKKVIIDTDIGEDIDDAYALALALKSPELEIKAILTNGKYKKEKAKIAHKLLETANRPNIPVFQGLKGAKGRLVQKKFIQNYKFKPERLESNLDFFKTLFKKKISYISLGSLTNLAFLLKKFPFIKKLTKFYIMGGSLTRGYRGGHKPVPEANIASDIKASKQVFQSGAKIIMVGLDSTWNLKLPKREILRIKNSETPLNQALDYLYKCWKEVHSRNPILYDPFAVAILIDEQLARFKKYKVYVDDNGITRWGQGPEVKVAINSNREKFLKFFLNRILKLENPK